VCLECDKIEEDDRAVEGDGYNIDDFENVYAYVTFNHEAVKEDLLKRVKKVNS
jgi:hypothetical protein